MRSKYFLCLGLISLGTFFSTTNTQVLTTVIENDRSVDTTLTEAASPSIPLASTTYQEKSKLQLYQSIFPLIANLNVSSDMAKKVIDRFLMDVVDVTINTTRLTTPQVSSVVATIINADSSLEPHINNLKNQTTPSAVALRQSLTNYRTTFQTKQTALNAKIKTQNDFLNQLNQARAIQATQLSSRVNSYQNMLNQVSQSILIDVQQEYFNDLSRLISYAVQAKRTTQENQAIKNLLDNAARLLPDRIDLINSFRTALAQQDQLIPPGTSIFAPTQQTGFTTTTTTTATPFTSSLTSIPQTTQSSFASFSSSTPTAFPAQTIPAALPMPTTLALAAPAPVQAAPPIVQAVRPRTQPTPTAEVLPSPPAAPQAVTSRPKPPKHSKPASRDKPKSKEPVSQKKPRGKAAIAKITAAVKPVIKPADKSATPRALTKEQQKQASLAALVKEFPTIKASLESSTDFLQIISTCQKAITLLSTKIKPEQKLTLKQLLAQRIPQLYNERANRAAQEISALAALLQTLSKNKETVALASQKQLETINALAAITIALSQKNPTQQLASFVTATQSLTPNIDRYEKQLFMDGIATLFNTRKTLTKAEQAQLQNIFATLTSKQSRKKKIFEAATYQQFENWAHITQCTVTLTAPTPQKTFKDLVRLYQGTLPYISRQEAAYEREFFIANTLPSLFAHRGNVKLSDIRSLRSFFDKTVKTPNLLAANQVPTLMFWLQELTNAQSIATHEKTYLEALIDRATASKNTATYSNALALFTQHTNISVRKAFIIALNALFSQRNTQPVIDKQQLLNLLDEVGKKKLTPAMLFLSTNQKTKLSEWQATLIAEMRQGRQ